MKYYQVVNVDIRANDKYSGFSKRKAIEYAEGLCTHLDSCDKRYIKTEVREYTIPNSVDVENPDEILNAINEASIYNVVYPKPLLMQNKDSEKAKRWYLLETAVKLSRTTDSRTIPSYIIVDLAKNSECSQAVIEYGESKKDKIDIKTMYEIVLGICKKNLIQEDSRLPRDTRRLIKSISKIAKNDIHAWENELPDELRCKLQNTPTIEVPTIRMVARDGSYEHIVATEEEAARMLQHDERLEDVGEDL